MLTQSEYLNKILCGHVHHVLRQLPDGAIQACITSPPYWSKREYPGEQDEIWEGREGCEHEWGTKNVCVKCGAWKGSLGREPIHDCLAWARGEKPCPVCFVCHLRTIFAEIWRVLRDDGIVFLNLGDTSAGAGHKGKTIDPKYPIKPDALRLTAKGRTGQSFAINNKAPGLKAKDLCMIPSRVAMALQADGWYLRSIPPWLKRNANPESVADRPSTSNEWIIMLTKSGKPQFWTHPRKRGVRKKPKPDIVYTHKLTGEQAPYQPVSDRLLKKLWKRNNLWKSHHYYYDIGATRIPHKTADKRNISSRQQKYRGKFDKDVCEKVSSPRARLSRDGYNPSFYHPGGRNRRTSDWWYESLDGLIWEVTEYLDHLMNIKENKGMLTDEQGLPIGFDVTTKGFKQAHFAIFPEALIIPCILASTSPKACAHCGAPYHRVTKRTTGNKSRSVTVSRGVGKASPLPVPVVTTVDWLPTCDCTPVDDSGPSILLDPFIGSGTTGIVAVRFGRAYVGIEISEIYVAMSEERIAEERERIKQERRQGCPEDDEVQDDEAQ